MVQFGAPLEIRVDRMCLIRVFRNLVDNALKYGGTEFTRLEIGYEERDDAHVFSVSDNGTGIPEGDARRSSIFFSAIRTRKASKGRVSGWPSSRKSRKNTVGASGWNPNRESGRHSTSLSTRSYETILQSGSRPHQPSPPLTREGNTS
jgi:light-regulated signal transduction histidine kinase (bacteriophytochrome)